MKNDGKRNPRTRRVFQKKYINMYIGISSVLLLSSTLKKTTYVTPLNALSKNISFASATPHLLFGSLTNNEDKTVANCSLYSFSSLSVSWNNEDNNESSDSPHTAHIVSYELPVL